MAPFMPVMMFAILFGLSMDYEVFLISRIREEYLKHGDTRRAIADGLAKTARVITAAAAIMVVVFLAFLAAPDVFLKLFGIGLASAVFLDATIVRMVLVPAVMQLLGERNWWIPDWLERILPRLDVERLAIGGAEGRPGHLACYAAGSPGRSGSGGRGSPVAALAEHADHGDQQVSEGGDLGGEEREEHDDDVEGHVWGGGQGDGRDVFVCDVGFEQVAVRGHVAPERVDRGRDRKQHESVEDDGRALGGGRLLERFGDELGGEGKERDEHQQEDVKAHRRWRPRL